MRKLSGLFLLVVALDTNALFVQSPSGNYDVQQDVGGGFTVYGLSGQGITTVIPTGDGGYSVLSPRGVTNVYGDGATSRPGVVFDPVDGNVKPVLPE